MAAVLLTGAGGGFGKLTALALREKGHKVIGTLCDATGRNALVAAELRAAGVDVLEMDVTDDASVAGGVADSANSGLTCRRQ